MLAVTGIQSCTCEKNISSDKRNSDSSAVAAKQLPGELSISPNHFRAEGAVTINLVTDSKPPKISYSIFISDVLERGSSLIYPVSKGETIHTELEMAVGYRFLKGDTVIALIEERLQMNSDMPSFIVKGIRKK